MAFTRDKATCVFLNVVCELFGLVSAQKAKQLYFLLTKPLIGTVFLVPPTSASDSYPGSEY